MKRADQAVIAVALVLPTLVTWLYFEAFADQPLMAKLSFGIGKTIQFGLPLAWVLLKAVFSKRPVFQPRVPAAWIREADQPSPAYKR